MRMILICNKDYNENDSHLQVEFKIIFIIKKLGTVK